MRERRESVIGRELMPTRGISKVGSGVTSICVPLLV